MRLVVVVDCVDAVVVETEGTVKLVLDTVADVVVVVVAGTQVPHLPGHCSA